MLPLLSTYEKYDLFLHRLIVYLGQSGNLKHMEGANGLLTCLTGCVSGPAAQYDDTVTDLY